MRAFPINPGDYAPEFGSSLDEFDRRVVEVSGVAYQSMDDLVRDYQDVENSERLLMMCEAWLRLNHGTGYRLIRDPAAFKNRYRMAKQRNQGLRGRHATPGAYDVAEVSEPQLYHDTLRCYVEDRMNGVPYRVEIPWPTRPDALANFTLLPLEDEDDYI